MLFARIKKRRKYPLEFFLPWDHLEYLPIVPISSLRYEFCFLSFFLLIFTYEERVKKREEKREKKEEKSKEETFVNIDSSQPPHGQKGPH